MKTTLRRAVGPLLVAVGTFGCTTEPATIGPAGPLEATTPVVKFDVYHRPFAEIPLPNDFAGKVWEFEVQSAFEVLSVGIAQSPQELASG